MVGSETADNVSLSKSLPSWRINLRERTLAICVLFTLAKSTQRNYRAWLVLGGVPYHSLGCAIQSFCSVTVSPQLYH